MGNANQVLADFPGLNFVRLSIYNYQSPDAYAAFINTMTSRGVVVELEDHKSTDGSNQGGSRGTAFSGSQLSDESNWYASLARQYASNPYVWFGTDNEPPNAGLSAWQQQTYDAIRNTGNNNPIMLELPGGGYPGGQTVNSYGMDPGVYSKMSNVVMDVHFYGWDSNYNSDQQAVSGALNDLVQGAKTVPSANGSVPVIIGEYGMSTDGSSTDANATQVLQQAQQAQKSGLTSGAVAWTWDTGGNNSLTSGGNLTSYGQEVAQSINSSQQSTGRPTASADSAASSNVTADKISLTLSGDSFQGSPQFLAKVDGQSVTAQPVAVTAEHGTSTQTFDFMGNWGAGTHDVEIDFVNDSYDSATHADRNLYVEQVSLNGHGAMSQVQPLYSNGSIHVNVS